MARRVLAQIADFKNLELVGIISRSQAGDDFGVSRYASLDELNIAADLLIDFTLPGGPRLAAQWCETNNVALLSGTTGLNDEDIQALKSAALSVPVLWSPNLSHGVALMTALVRQVADVLGVQANIAISDIHHKHKLDAPSGTALALAHAALEGRSEPLQDMLSVERLARPASAGHGQLAFSSVREGEVVGEHTVSFAVADEVIEITHKALDREVFAKGALRAGEWLVKQKPGYYTTREWLGLS